MVQQTGAVMAKNLIDAAAKVSEKSILMVNYKNKVIKKQ